MFQFFVCQFLQGGAGQNTRLGAGFFQILVMLLFLSLLVAHMVARSLARKAAKPSAHWSASLRRRDEN